MKNFLASAILFAGASVWAAEDDYILYWQLVQNEYSEAESAIVGATMSDKGSAQYLTEMKDGGTFVDLNGDGATTLSQVGMVIGKTAPVGYSFFVELLDGDNKTLWTSSLFAYNALLDYISQPAGSSGGNATPDNGAWKVSAIKEEKVPEPTSGLLMLLGLAGLALRRRRRVC